MIGWKELNQTKLKIAVHIHEFSGNNNTRAHDKHAPRANVCVTQFNIDFKDRFERLRCFLEDKNE